jgi:hypothetical protein
MKTPFVYKNYDKLAAKIDEYADKLYDNYDEEIVASAISSLRNDGGGSPLTKQDTFKVDEREWAFGLVLKSNVGKERFKKIAKTHFLEPDRDMNKINSYAKFAVVIQPLDFLLKCAKRIKLATKNADKGSFGKYAWANNRSLSSLMPFEKDEPIESSAFRQLQKYFDGKTSAVDKKTASTLGSLLKQGKYSDVIKEPTIKVVMRGMWLNLKQLKTILGDKEFSKIKVKLDTRHSVSGFRKKILKSFTFKPKFNVSSWTTKPSVAVNFALDNAATDLFGIILYANVSDNQRKFLQCDNGLYKINDFAMNMQEHEVLALGDIKVNSVMIMC